MLKTSKLFLMSLIIAGGVFSSGCVAADYAVRKGGEAATNKLEEVEKREYIKFAAALSAKGRNISEVDTNLDGKISPTESAKWSLKNPMDTMEFWGWLLSLPGAYLGTRLLRKKFFPRKPTLGGGDVLEKETA